MSNKYEELIGGVGFGKRLRDSVYLHMSCLDRLPNELIGMIDRARNIAHVSEANFNVVKFAVGHQRISLLYYPSFFEEGFPCLEASWMVDLNRAKCSFRSYASSPNPPVLHRKEELLPPRHPAIESFKLLTKAAEEAGLFDDISLIGTRKPWELRLQRIGLRVEGNRLVNIENSAANRNTAEPVYRHRTALTRYSLSTPMQALWRHGYLCGKFSVFDYGCGRGDDIRALSSLGVQASGWDPHFALDRPRSEADIVNLGFVLNVIEDVIERREALISAYSLARRFLVVSVLLGGRTAYERYRLYRDGVLTQKGTFQKYYTQDELRNYLEENLRRQPVAVAPGTFFLFKQDDEEQRFLAERQTSRRAPMESRSVPCGASGRLFLRERPARRPSRWELHGELLELFWECCINLGRLPEDDEFDRSEEVRLKLGRPRTVLRHLLTERGQDSFEAGRNARMGDLLVYLALNLFERRKSFVYLPRQVRLDIRAFWSNYRAAEAEARRLLFSAGDVETIRFACLETEARQVGYMDGNSALYLHSSLIQQLPPVLRIYLGCATRLYGELENAELIKIHIASGKVSLMSYDDFDARPIPHLIERVKINLRLQEVEFFDYGPAVPSQPLYMKSRYLPRDHPNLPKQEAFDNALENLGVFDFTGYGPDGATFTAALREHGYEVHGFKIRRRRRDDARQQNANNEPIT